MRKIIRPLYKIYDLYTCKGAYKLYAYKCNSSIITFMRFYNILIVTSKKYIAVFYFFLIYNILKNIYKF